MKSLCRDHIPFHIKLFGWLNIVVQAIFPLAITFIPATAGARNESHFFENVAQTSSHTQVYILGENETFSSVAEKYNISIEALGKLNQLRTFAHGFRHLKPGMSWMFRLQNCPKFSGILSHRLP